MSYDLIESTLIRLGEQIPERLSVSFQSREADLPSARRCETKRPSAALLLAEEASYRRVRVRSQREPLMKKTAFVSSALALLFASVTAHAQAQVTVDVSKIPATSLLNTRS